MEKIMKSRLADSYVSRLTFQDYTPGAKIEGVVQVSLKKHRALEGWFMEYLRLRQGKVEKTGLPFQVEQISFSYAEPSRINAFHIHPKRIQDELWCVVQGALKVWLVDLREDSSTLEYKQCVLLSGESPSLLHIPSGVAHGYQAGREGALLVYAMNSQFSMEDPNEGRLPWDLYGKDLWEEDHG